MSSALPSPNDCCAAPPCPSSACGTPIDLTTIIQQEVSTALDVFSVKAYGATGNGITDDTAAIQATISAAPDGGVIYFPSGQYVVRYADNLPASSLFKYRSNQIFVGDRNAQIIVTNYHSALGGIFGADLSALPITNVQFIGLRFQGLDPTLAPIGAGQFINVLSGMDSAPDSIVNLRVQDCEFINAGGAVYIKQMSSVGSETRQVRNVIISNCFSQGCIGSFVTVEGKDITVSNNIVVGWPANPLLSFDAVSIHSGIGVLVSGNQFRFYGGTNGIAVNIRNNVDSHCGSRNISVVGNTFKDCPQKCVGVYLQDGEFVYGVKHILISENSFEDTAGAIVLNPTATTDAGTPFTDIKIGGNNIVTTATGINCIGSALKRIDSLSITDNTIKMDAAGTVGVLLQLVYASVSTVNGNKLFCNNTATQLAVVVNHAGLITFNDNTIYSTNNLVVSVTFDDISDYILVGNNFYCQFTIAIANNAGVIEKNHTPAPSTFIGHPVGIAPWGFHNGRFFYTSGATPVGGTWVVGDYILNSLAVDELEFGWIYTSTGWKTFGAIV